MEPAARPAGLFRSLAVPRAASVRRRDQIVTIGEGQTLLQRADKVGRYVGLDPGSLWLQYEGMNPSGQLQRQRNDRRIHACSHGFCPARRLCQHGQHLGGPGGLLLGDRSRASARSSSSAREKSLTESWPRRSITGRLTIQIVGDFDDAMQRVRQVADRLGIYLMNSINPFRLEGQKAIIFRVLEGLRWEVPDWIVVPGGNLGNSSAFGKAFIELHYLGLISRVPRLAVINAAGAQTLNELVGTRQLQLAKRSPGNGQGRLRTTSSSMPSRSRLRPLRPRSRSIAR